MKIFFDTEFTDLLGIEHTPALISIGLAAEKAAEGTDTFYAELTDTWTPEICSDFVLEAVLPELTGGDARMTEAEAANQLKAWIEAFQQPVQLYSDAPSFDWPFVEDLFDRHGWPENLVRKCAWIETDDFAMYEAIEAFWTRERGSVRHHALWDALSLRIGWRAISGDSFAVPDATDCNEKG
ncbi:MAG: 3'-5' exoribonuclease [Actinomycetota bacterium]|nr:3'-5' exoribonuclease [Actinomycetota bacterium]MDZ4201916.1 3'-5' exoribonuclease [Gallionella sp.]